MAGGGRESVACVRVCVCVCVWLGVSVCVGACVRVYVCCVLCTVSARAKHVIRSRDSTPQL